MVEQKKAKYFIQTSPKGSIKDKKVYFATYAEAKRYVEKYIPGPKGIYHINSVDNSGYAGKSNGRTSYHEPNYKDRE